MCLIVLSVEGASWWLLANRDEFRGRKALGLARWADLPGCAGGRDQVGGGTWLLAHADGRLAAVTNFRGGAPGSNSRGLIPGEFLSSRLSPAEFIARLQARRNRYAAFNLLLHGADGWWIYCSANDRTLGPLHGNLTLSNGDPQQRWPKMCWTADVLSRLHRRGASPLAGFGPMRRARAFDSADLPDTGVGPRLERALSPPFIRLPGYGTRCTTLLAGNTDQQGMWMIERRYGPSGRRSGQTRLWLHPDAP